MREMTAAGELETSDAGTGMEKQTENALTTRNPQVYFRAYDRGALRVPVSGNRRPVWRARAGKVGIRKLYRSSYADDVVDGRYAQSAA